MTPIAHAVLSAIDARIFSRRARTTSMMLIIMLLGTAHVCMCHSGGNDTTETSGGRVDASQLFNVVYTSVRIYIWGNCAENFQLWMSRLRDAMHCYVYSLCVWVIGGGWWCVCAASVMNGLEDLGRFVCWRVTFVSSIFNRVRTIALIVDACCWFAFVRIQFTFRSLCLYSYNNVTSNLM